MPQNNNNPVITVRPVNYSGLQEQPISVGSGNLVAIGSPGGPIVFANPQGPIVPGLLGGFPSSTVGSK